MKNLHKCNTKFNSDMIHAHKIQFRQSSKKMIFHSINYEMLLILSPGTVIDYNVSTCFGSHTIHREIEKLMYVRKYIIKKVESFASNALEHRILQSKYLL